MTINDYQHIPVSGAWVCFDKNADGDECGTVGNCAERCPACGNRNLLSLSAVLNRKDRAEATERAERQ